MKLLTFVSVLLLAALSGCSDPKVDFEAENNALKENLRRFADYMNNENVSAFVALFTTEARLTLPDSSAFEGPDTIRAWIEERFSFFDFELELTPDEGGILIYPAGESAFAKGAYLIRRTPKTGGEAENESGWYRMFWVKDTEGNWRLSRLNWLDAPSFSEDPDAY